MNIFKNLFKKSEDEYIQLPKKKFSKFKIDRKREIKTLQLSQYKRFSEHEYFNELYEGNSYNVNIGGGQRSSYYNWFNLDCTDNKKKDKNFINFNFFEKKPFPFQDNQVDIIYCSHVLEHLTDDIGEYILKESKRVLRSGGLIRIVVPDWDLAVEAYLRKDLRFFEEFYKKNRIYEDAKENDCENYIEYAILRFFATQLCVRKNPNNYLDKLEIFREKSKSEITQLASKILESINLNIQMENPQSHINFYNFKKISDILAKFNFKNITKSQYGYSENPKLRDLRYFDDCRPEKSLFVEAKA